LYLCPLRLDVDATAEVTGCPEVLRAMSDLLLADPAN